MRLFIFCFAILLALPVIWPSFDLLASGLFYRAGQGFYLADNIFFVTLHWLAYDGARVLGVAFAVLAVVARIRCRPVGGGDSKAWMFMLLALMIGPVLIANVGLKDHWGRARPREVVAFGGADPFTPALEPHFDRGRSNGSFVAGDGAFGFFLPTFAYIAPRRRSRRVFWATMTAGGVFSFARLVMGAHFFSDIVYAAFFMLASSAAVHMGMRGRRQTVALWRSWFSVSKDV